VEVSEMGIQSRVLFVGLGIALIGGVVAGVFSAELRHAGWLATGLVPLGWALVSLIERFVGHELWHYTAAYPEYQKAREDATRAPRLPIAEAPNFEWSD